MPLCPERDYISTWLMWCLVLTILTRLVRIKPYSRE